MARARCRVALNHCRTPDPWLARLANRHATRHIRDVPTRNVNLTEHQDRFVERAISVGRYQNASEVLRDGLRLLERREAEDEAKLTRLRLAIGEARTAVAQGEYEDVRDDQLVGWLAGLGDAART